MNLNSIITFAYLLGINQVKFMVKIVVGSTLDAIIMEERNNSGATSVVIGRSLSIYD